jgi:hypothetical protein
VENTDINHLTVSHPVVNKKHKDTLRVMMLNVDHLIIPVRAILKTGKGGQESACLEEQRNLLCVGGFSVSSETNIPLLNDSVGDKLVTVLRDT